MEQKGQIIYTALRENRWLHIHYKNKNEDDSYFWFDVLSINPDKKTLSGTMYNYFKNKDVLYNTVIYYDQILEAKELEFCNSRDKTDLLNKIENNPDEYKWMDFISFNNNVLLYFEEARRLDVDPVQKKHYLIPGIDFHSFDGKNEIPLNEDQIKFIIDIIFEMDVNKNKYLQNEFIMSTLSIDNDDKKYVVAYKLLTFQPDKKTLCISDEIHFNKEVTDERRKGIPSKFSMFSLGEFDVDSFFEFYKEDSMKATLVLQKMLDEKFGSKWKVNTLPEMMILERSFPVKLAFTYEMIERQYAEKTLSAPLKAFFGNISRRGGKKKEPSIVIYDNKINISQMRVLYNAMKENVTYVKGPPGTGKTQTILNVILSNLLNHQTTLICSANNKPVDGIIGKFLTDFKYKDRIIELPYLRLGNLQILNDACDRILHFYNSKYSDKLITDDEKLNKIKVNNDNINEQLVNLLSVYEEREEQEQKVKILKKMLKVSSMEENQNFYEAIKKVYWKNEEILKGKKEITQEEALSLFVPAKSNSGFLQFLFFDTLKRIRSLKQPKFKDLIAICMKNEETRGRELKEWLKNVDHLKLLLTVFPIIFTTNISAEYLGNATPIFDMVIMDEAGQCNPADALLSISRGKKLLMVGDPYQLKPVIQLDEGVNALLMEKYRIPPVYDYRQNSILEMMTSMDKVSNYIMLAYHYRCGKRIINFSNNLYYQKQLHLEKIKEEGNLLFIDSKNSAPLKRNSCLEEAKAIVNYIKKNGYKDTSILTPFVNQKDLINEMLVDEGIIDVKAQTIHTMQGAESNTVIISLALSPKTSKGTWEWLKNNQELINVAVTRAKKNLVVLADKEAVDKLGKGKEDVSQLVNYMKTNGTYEVQESEKQSNQIDLSNGSRNEKEFFETISHFCSCNSNFTCKRNVYLKDLYPGNKEAEISNQQFDLVLFNKEGSNLHPSIVFEVDGGEHFGNAHKEYLDRRKNAFCESVGLKEVVIPNSLVKDYELIFSLVLDYSKTFKQLDAMSKAEVSKEETDSANRVNSHQSEIPAIKKKEEVKKVKDASPDKKKNGFLQKLFSFFNH